MTTTTQEILKSIEENNGRLTAQNDANGWYALTREGYHYIEWDNGTVKYYATAKSWAIRVSRLVRTGK
jgi:hypothetical protein